MHRMGRAYGIPDIDALDDAITDKQLLEHQAAAWIDGWYHGRTPTAEIVAELRNLGNVIVAAQSTEPTKVAEELTWHSSHSVIDQMTATKPVINKSKTMITTDQWLQQLENQHGK